MVRPVTSPASLQSVGQRIVWARKRKGISQERLAELIGTSRRHMNRIETGRTVRPTDRFLERIAEATEQDVAFFVPAEATLDDEDEESALRRIAANAVLVGNYEVANDLLRVVQRRTVAA